MSYQQHLLPELFQNNYLFQTELESGLPLRLILVGLACRADKAGRFRWKPEALKAAVLPYDTVDFEAALDLLVKEGFLLCYNYELHFYGAIAAPTKPRRRDAQNILSAV